MRTTSSRKDVLSAVGLIIIGSVGIQISSAIASTLFADLGPLAVSALRMSIAAIVLLAVFRPKIRGRSKREWIGIVIYGVAMAAMNISLYEAIHRLPLGVAVTLEFLGPCAVALFASRRVVEGVLAVAALAGVVLIAGPAGYGDVLGIFFGLSAGLFFAIYTVASARVGKSENGISGLAWSVTIAAVLSLPLVATAGAAPTPPQWGVLALSAIIGVSIPYTVDTLAAKLTSARVVGTLFSMDPLVAALFGFLLLGETISGLGFLGIAIVVAAGAGMVWSSGKPDKTLQTDK